MRQHYDQDPGTTGYEQFLRVYGGGETHAEISEHGLAIGGNRNDGNNSCNEVKRRGIHIIPLNGLIK